jgi:catechol 2,3-dioxygenase-like lactoylglutathione lyase family enzyme
MNLNLNHLNLVVADVAQMTGFFERFFAFRCLDRRGDALAVLQGQGQGDGVEGFLLVLMRPAAGESAGSDAPAYPASFHIGFYVDGEPAVRAKHAELRDAGLDVNDVKELHRAGATTVTFYCHAPGGLLVEVSSR